MYSAATAALLLAYSVLLVADVLLNPEARFGFAITLILAALAFLASGFCLVMGDRLGPWPAVILVFSNALTIVLFFAFLQKATGAVGNLVQVPVLALYLGAFLKPWLARFSQAAVFVILLMAILWDPLDSLDRLDGGRNGINIVIFAWLCLEAGIFVQKRFRAETRFDELTGVYNRRGLIYRSDLESSRAERSGLPICVAMVDLDDFKALNDTRGHATGDRVLRDLTKQWKLLMREGDVISRVGGDEFIFLMPDTRLEGARRMLTRINEVAVHPWSWGVVEWDTNEIISVAIGHADEEMYQNKLARRQLRNAALPIVTLAGLQLGHAFSGAVLVEVVFSLPGIGPLLYDSIIRHDYPIMLGILFGSAFTVVAANILTDLVYRVLDPRIRLHQQ